MRYPFIRAWYLCSADLDAGITNWNGDEDMVLEVVRRARDAQAPYNATYFSDKDQRWHTIEDCRDPVWKSRVTKLAMAFEDAAKKEIAS